MPTHAYGASVGPDQSDLESHGRRWARAVVAEQRVQIAAADSQIQIVDRYLIAVRSVDLLKFDHRLEDCGSRTRAVFGCKSFSASLIMRGSVQRSNRSLRSMSFTSCRSTVPS